MVRIKRMYKRFLLLVLVFTVSALSIHLLPQYYNTDSFLLLLNYPRLENNQIPATTAPKFNLWKVNEGEDRIWDQVNFNTSVDTINSSPKTILVQFGTGGWGVPSGNSVFIEQNCNVKHCVLLDSAPSGVLVDARIFKENDLVFHDLPRFLKETPRIPQQIWIMFGLESPVASPEYSEMKHVINWTATYRPDSTVVAPYDKWMPFDNFTTVDNAPLLKNYAAGKTRKVAMFVSNCPTSNKRMEFVKALKQHIQVDVYGSCGDLVCERDDDRKCFDILRKDYKFYLAFENANCRHYITEKLFMNALHYDVLPVVMGAHPDDYRRAAPPRSYIHVEDFETPEDLAYYLLLLDSNENLYNEYFRWKSTGYFLNTKFWCRICAMLWDPEQPTLSVADLDFWWRGNKTCIADRRWTNKGRQMTKL